MFLGAYEIIYIRTFFLEKHWKCSANVLLVMYRKIFSENLPAEGDLSPSGFIKCLLKLYPKDKIGAKNIFGCYDIIYLRTFSEKHWKVTETALSLMYQMKYQMKCSEMLPGEGY